MSESLSLQQRVDGVCLAFEAAWRVHAANPEGQPRPRLEDVLDQAAESDRPLLFRELLAVELAYRRQQGDTPQVEDYQARFPGFAEVIPAALAASAERQGRTEDFVPSGPTGDLSQNVLEPPALGTCVRYFGDYELLEEIAPGVGAQGVVYKAQQITLHRLVALKMILTGRYAPPERVQRFRLEAEAAAHLEHEHIVPIYEVGEHEGLPYFTMRLIEGGNLAGRIADFGGKPRAAAELVATLARAVHHAHQRGVLHRDLKPANVLLDQEGRPYVTDFGLAKLLEGYGPAGEAGGMQTGTGAILGTPAYMAPEQARGERGVTTAADIYSLGAILYELLTGRQPFVGSGMQVLQAVQEREPERPRVINEKVDRDLETIVLKCLEKEPRKRYGTAQEVAEELGRWLGGQPILARPVGRLYRAWRWCKRNPVVAGLTAAVVVVLLGGIGGIAWSYGQAVVERNRALDAEGRARENEGLAVKAREETEQAFAGSLLRPLDMRSLGADVPKLTEPEVEALWELARQRPRGLGRRFVAEALRDGQKTRQLRNRAAIALHAAVGLDERERAEVEDMLCQALRNESLSEEQRRDVALTILDGNPLGHRASSEAIHFICEGVNRNSDLYSAPAVARNLSLVAGGINGQEAALAFVGLAQAMSKTTDPEDQPRLVEGLVALGMRLEEKENSQNCATAATFLVQAIEKKQFTLFGPGYHLDPDMAANFFSWVFGRLERKEAKEVVFLLVKAIGRPGLSDTLAMEVFGNGLSAVAERLEEKEAGELAPLLVEVMGKTMDARVLAELAKGLSALAGRMEAKEASRHCAAAAAHLVQAMGSAKNPDGLDKLAKGLSLVAGQLEGKEAWRQCDIAATLLVQAMGKTLSKNPSDFVPTLGLSTVVARLGEKEASRYCAATATLLVQAVGKTTTANDPYWGGPYWPGNSLSVVAGRLEAKEARELAPLLLQAMGRTPNASALSGLAQSLSGLAGRMEAEEGSRYCSVAASLLVQAVGKNTAPFFPSWRGPNWLENSLSVVAGRLETKEARKLAPLLVQAMGRTANEFALAELAKSLSALAGRLEEKEASRHCAAAAALLVQTMGKTKNAFAFNNLAPVYKLFFTD